MAVNLSPVGGVAAQFFDNSGNVLTGGKLYTYLAGTTTPATTYTTSSGNTAQPNPIVFNAAGRVPDSGEIWLSDGVLYKFSLQDQYGVQIATYDNIDGINSNFVSYTSQNEVQTATQGQTVFTLATIQYTPATNNLAVYVNGSKQIGPTNYVETGSTTVTFVSGLNVGDIVEFSTATPVATNATSAANVSYNEGSTGAVTRTLESKLQETISVLDFGADPTGTTDSSTAFLNAQNAAQTQGIGVFVPDGTYKILNSSPFPTQTNFVTPVNIRTGANVTYTGTIVSGQWGSIPTFGASKANEYNLSAYNYLYSAPNQAIQDPGALGTYPFGFATLSVDSMPVTSFQGNADAAFFQAVGQSGANFALGGINVVSTMNSGFLGNANCMELDLGNFAGNGKGLGMTVIGKGTYEPEVAIKLARIATGSQSPTGAGGNWIPAYQNGIEIYNAKQGLYIDQTQVQTPDSAIGISPGPQSVPTNAAIYVDDPNSTANFVVQNNGYIAYRDSSPITSFGTNVVSGTSPQSDDQYLIANKTVRLAGKVTATFGNTVTSGSTLFTLDAQYRPNRTVILPAVTDNGTVTWIQIASSGVVTCGINLTSAFYLTLDSVSYLLNN